MTSVNRDKRGIIFLGDLAHALHGLSYRTDDEIRRITNCLGLAVQPAEPMRSTTEVYDPRTAEQPRHVERLLPAPTFATPRLPDIPPALPQNSLPSELQDVPGIALPEASEPEWLQSEDPVFNEMAEAQPVPCESLFPERTHRHILTASLATMREGRDIEIGKLLNALIGRKILKDLPRCTEATLDRGCDLLLDYSSTMVPYWEDLNALIKQVHRVIGTTNCQVCSFDGQPSEAKFWTASGQRKPWCPQKRPILAATDFGHTGHTERAQADPDWKKFIANCATDGSPLIILVPWPKPRWPSNLGPYPSLIHWSPHTSAARIKRKLGSKLAARP